MDYEKKYKEANGKVAARFGINIAKEIFTDLYESEDEKIRKWLISQLKIKSDDTNSDLNIMIDKAISWLEKQEGCEYIKKDWLEHIKQSWYKEGFIDGKYSGGASKEWTTNDAAIFKEIIDFLENGTAKLQHDLTKYANWLKIQFTPIEKQGEQKSIWHNEDEEPKRDSLILLIMQSGTPIVAKIIEPNHTFNHGERWAYIDDLLEKQGEQKPASKVEPKFKNGQWIVWQDKYYKVNYNGCGYELVDQNGLSTSLEYGTIEENAHLWTIQDAKDGDVLVSLDSSQPFIYKERKPHEQMTAYCGINIYGKFFVWNTEDCIITLNRYIPATKEQRDLLFSKMKEAGYEWDSEKKELKLLITNGGDFLESENRDQNPAWSEEDERNFEVIIDEIEANKNDAPDYDIKTYDRFLNWLKSLKDRYTWRPSEEQMYALAWALSLAKACGEECAFDLRTLLEQLKNL